MAHTHGYSTRSFLPQQLLVQKNISAKVRETGKSFFESHHISNLKIEGRSKAKKARNGYH